MNILFLSAREFTYERNLVNIKALRKFANVEIISPETKPKSLIIRSILISFKAIILLKKRRFDVIFIGFYGYLLIYPMKLFTRTPVIFDAFVSNYDTLINDRKKANKKSLISILSKLLDKSACKLSDHVIMDTLSNAMFFNFEYGIKKEKITVIPVGCNEDIFNVPIIETINKIKIVLFYSTYMPLHGINTIINAAKILKLEGLKFVLVGNGMEYPNAKLLAEKFNLDNVEFIEYLPIEKLGKLVKIADICLGGHFGLSEKANRVIPGKIYQMLACGKPIIAANTSANNELLSDRENVIFCPQNDANKLAETILELINDKGLCTKIGKNGRILFEKCCSEQFIAKRLENLLNFITN